MNLSGVWYGRYDGAADVPSNRFIALLTDTDGRIGGTISEPDDLGIDDVRRALVSGARGGRSVRFVKQYDGAVVAHSVSYDGMVDEKGVEITGSWRFADYTGAFVMARDAPLEEEVADMVGTEEPVR